MKEAFLVNPPGRRKRRKTKAKSRRRNAPKRRKRRKTVVVRVNAPAKRRKRRATTVVRVNAPRKRRRNRSKKRRRSYRRNPAEGSMRLTMRNFQKNIPYMLTGGVSAIATTMAPGIVGKMLPGMAGSNLLRYGSQVGMTVVGAFAVDKIVKKGHGTIWLIVGGATIMADLIKTFVMPQLGLAGYELEDYELSEYYDEGGMEAFPSTEDEMGFDAFPPTEEEETYQF